MKRFIVGNKKMLFVLMVVIVAFIASYNAAYGACPFVVDNFDDGILDANWTAEARDGAIIEQGGQVEITAGSGDIWDASFTPTWIYQCMEQGNFDLYTKITSPGIVQIHQQAGILYSIDDANHYTINLKYSESDNSRIVQVRETVNNVSGQSKIALSNDPLWLRAKRSDGGASAYYAVTEPVEEGDWIQLAETNQTIPGAGGETKVGLYAVDPRGNTFLAKFDYLKAWVSGAVPPPADATEINLRLGWDWFQREGENVVLESFPLYMTRTSGTNYTKLVDVPVVGEGTYYESGVVEFMAVEGETLHFAMGAKPVEGEESVKSEELVWVVPSTEPTPVCGDGIINQASEQCDDGNTEDGDGCSQFCQTEVAPPDPFCGDGTIDPGEECDDGNTVNGDGCDSNCQEEPVQPLPPKTVRIIVTIEIPDGISLSVETKTQ